jgi:hypothetical protein
MFMLWYVSLLSGGILWYFALMQRRSLIFALSSLPFVMAATVLGPYTLVAFNCAMIGTIHFKWAVETRQQIPPNQSVPWWWVLRYGMVVLTSWFAAFALIGFSIDAYIGGLVVAFEFGLLAGGWFFVLTR